MDNDKKVFKNAEDFRQNATDQDYIELQKYVDSFKGRTKDAFKEDDCIYKFSYTTAFKFLQEHFKTEKQARATKKEFVIGSITDTDFRQRSFKISVSVLERLNRFCDVNNQYNKQIVVNALLDEILKMYEGWYEPEEQKELGIPGTRKIHEHVVSGTIKA